MYLAKFLLTFMILTWMLDKLHLLGRQKQVITAMSDVGFYMNDLNIQPKLLRKLLKYGTPE